MTHFHPCKRKWYVKQYRHLHIVASQPNGAKKFHWRWQQNSWITILFGGILQRCRLRAYLHFSAKYFSFHFCILGERSDPGCPTQGNFTSSAVQTPVSIIVEPLYVTYWTSVVKERRDICYYAYLAENLLGYTLFSVSVLTLTAISVDRLLALLLGLRYRQIVTFKRTCITAFGFWILSIECSPSYSLVIKPKIALGKFKMSGRID